MNHEHSLSRRNFLSSTAGFAIAGASGLLLPRVSGIALAAEPTLEETLNWLQLKIKTESSVRFSWKIGKEREAQINILSGEIISSDHETISLRVTDRIISAVNMPAKQRSVMESIDHYDISPGNLFSNVIAEETNPPKSGYDEKDTELSEGPRTYFSVVLRLHKVNSPISHKSSFRTYEIDEENKITNDKLVDNGSSPASKIAIPFQNKDVADRVAKAFSHAIKLCGGEEEAF